MQLTASISFSPRVRRAGPTSLCGIRSDASPVAAVHPATKFLGP
jgi:hypothetical protein